MNKVLKCHIRDMSEMYINEMIEKFSKEEAHITYHLKIIFIEGLKSQHMIESQNSKSAHSFFQLIAHMNHKLN